MTYELEMMPDEEIRGWMDAEMARMGDWFRDFEISWGRNETHHYLTVWSHAKPDFGRMNHPFGKGLDVAWVADPDGESLPLIQSEGRKLYYRLKGQYVIHRDLGRN